MSAARPADEQPAPDDVAAALRDAPFVRVAARADGDALAAAGLLARALREVDIPFQVRTDPDPAPDPVADDSLALVVGARAPEADTLVGVGADTPASVQAFAVARNLGVEPDPILGLAGVVAAGVTPGADGSDALLAAAEERNSLARRPGVAIPTADLDDGLAHSTLLHAPFSGDIESARAALSGLDSAADPGEETRRRVASLTAVAAVSAEGTVPRAADAVERALRPYETPEASFATVGGYADVLGAVARERPGVGVALALSEASTAADASEQRSQSEREAESGIRTAALDAWREHASLVHTELRDATTGRYDGLFVARLGASASVGRLATAARLLRDFQSPEPVALAVADGAAAATRLEGAPPEDLGRAAADAAARLRTEGDADATGYGTRRHGEATFESDTSTFIAAFREEL